MSSCGCERRPCFCVAGWALLARKAERLRELADTLVYARELTDAEAHELRDVSIEIARFING